MEAELEEFVSIENRLIMRKLLIVSVGSSASIHLLRGIASKNPTMLSENEFVLVETSEDMLNIAVEALSSTYQSFYAYKRGEPAEKYKGFPTSAFKHKLKENSVLLAKGGGATTPELGLRYYSEKRNYTLNKIVEVYKKNNCTGIVIFGSSGKGTGTLVTPALISDLIERTGIDINHPIGFITLPFRFRKTDVDNAKKTIEFIINNTVPCFLLDYEHALNMYLYLTEEKPRKPTVSSVYRCVVDALANVLGALIEALNYGQYCSPPMDWSDLMPLMGLKGSVGTVAYTFRMRDEEFLKNWKKDLDRLILFRTKSKPSETNVMSIIRSGAGVPLELTELLSEYYSKSWNSRRHDLYVLEHGEGFTIASMIYGFDPRNIEPELKYKKFGWLGGIFG